MVMPQDPHNDPHDPFDLQRFVDAQADTYAAALSEIEHGRKRSHWMWFIFPQLRGLGSSPLAEHYGISGREETQAYLRHDLLGPRLEAICRAALAVPGRSAFEIFGTPDDLKLRSCATLFAQVCPNDAVFQEVLDRFFSGAHDARTLQLLRDQTQPPQG